MSSFCVKIGFGDSNRKPSSLNNFDLIQTDQNKGTEVLTFSMSIEFSGSSKIHH